MSLSLLSACSSQPTAITVNKSNYPVLSPCQPEPISIETNADLATALIQRDTELAQCALKVDSIIQIQATENEKAQ
ncbi:Rz1-like lysis system protein LysC [Acinetobacter baretiae]|uniref:Rz1-like lysis system protein LysC n=1 Tax=Acinetobacter baretiae TaxID=2605383 RepID=UPI0039A67F97